MPVRDVLIGERRIRYAEAGDGPALVLLHGGWADHRNLASSARGPVG